MQGQNNQQHAIQLIKVNEDGKYILTGQGSSFLSKITAPLAVVSVAGMYRTGKSYLLNRMLLNRSNGFGVGPTVNPCTKGLWCWSKTIPGKTVDGEPVNVIIIDTEGIGALDEDQTHDTRIFTLAILAASSFIYNSTGSIDENALQNLSLVVNLTKNIQLNAIESEEDQQNGNDPQELAEYFPSFYWVVRDFSLQLINSQGETITPKQYLQRALAPQKGFSDDIEQKNRIRRLLSAFFKERQCFTLVRPLVDQKKLQQLDQLQLDQLRPEFVEQAMNFRRRVLNRIKPKLLRGKQLNGQMYLCLLNSYVSSINNGAVPNIQNAWNYMCQQQCAKAFEQSLSTFNYEYGSSLKNNLPIEEQYLLDALHQIKQRACEQFQKKSVGEQVKFHLKQLRQKFEQKIQNIKIDNEKQSEIILSKYFKKNIIEIQNKLKTKQYDRFQQFTKGINTFYINILQCGPNLPRKQLVYLELIKKIVPMAAQFFLRQKNQQLDKLKITSTQKQLNYQKFQNQLKGQLQQHTELSKQKITKLDRQLIQLQLQFEQYRNLASKNVQEFQQKQQSYRRNIKQIQQKMRKQQQKSEQTINKLQDHINQLQNKQSADKCEQQKNNAVLQMRINQLQINLQQAKKKQSAIELALKNLQITSSQQIKQQTQKYEYQLKNKQLLANNLRESIAQLQQHNHTLQNQLTTLKKTTVLTNQTQHYQHIQKQQKLSDTINELQQQLKVLAQNNVEKLAQLTMQIQQKQQKQSMLERQYKNLQQQYTKKQNNNKTSLAVLEQKLEFVTVENSQYVQQISKIKKMYQQMIEQDKIRKIEDEGVRLERERVRELTEEYHRKIKDMEAQYDANVKKLTSQVENVRKTNSDQELQLKLLKTNYEALQKQKKQLQQQYNNKYQILWAQQTEETTKLLQQYRTKQQQYIEKIADLQQQIEQTKQSMIKQQSDQHQKSEQSVMQLKNYYELQKQRLQNKIVSQKQKYERKLALLKEQNQQKMQQQVTHLEEENQRLQDTAMQLEEELSKEKNLRKMESDIKSKNIQNLEKSVEQFKSKLEHKQTDLLQRIQKIQKDHQSEKQSLYSKIQELITATSKIQKQKINLNHNKQQLDKIIAQKDVQIKEVKQQILMIKAKIEKEREDSKNLRNQFNSKRNEERVQLEKKVALLEQENTYIKKKLEENEKNHGSQHQVNEQKLKKIKEQFTQQLKSQKDKLILQLQNTQKKYEKLKRSSKQTDSTHTKQISQLQKQLAISKQRNTNIAQKLASIQQKNSQQMQQYTIQLSSLKTVAQKQKQQLKQQLQKQFLQKQKIEMERNTMQASYHQDKILWENKNKFLEEGRERYKNQYQNTKNQLETAIEKNRKKWSAQKLASETAHSQQLAKLQKKYWAQKQQIMETHKRSQSQAQGKLKNLQYELRSLQEKVAMQQQNKQGQQVISEKKLKQLIQSQKKLQTQVQKLRSARQREQKEHQKIHQKQKQNIKQKYLDKQQKLKVSQKQRQHLFYQIQKQRAKWGIEKDTIVNKIEQQKQIIQKNQKDIQKLQRQNEKLKVQKKCHKNSMQSVSKYGGGFGNILGERVSSSRSSFEDSILKENSNSQISDTSIFFKE